MQESESSGGELVIMELQRLGVTDIFCLVGNQVSPILVNASKYNINLISTRHEQGAVHMADGWAQEKRMAGVAIVSGGPGFTNTITAIVKAYHAHTPLLVITGAVMKSQKDNGVLQDVDQIEMVQKYTKWSKVIYSTERIPEYIERALSIANSGIRGPVVLEIPIDVLKRKVNTGSLKKGEYCPKLVEQIAAMPYIKKAVSLIRNSRKPILIIGDEAYYDYAESEVNEFVKKTGIPVYSINKARGMVSDEEQLSMGTGRIIEGGPQLYAYENADLMILIGLYPDYQMGQLSEAYFKQVKEIININTFSEINAYINYKSDIQILGSIKENLMLLGKEVESEEGSLDFSNWVSELRDNRSLFFEELKSNAMKQKNQLSSYAVLDEISNIMKPDTIIVIDGSNAMFWASIMLNCHFAGQLIIAPDGSYGPMGTGVALAIGAKVANPDKDVILYTGDGSFGFNAMELDSLARLKMGIKIFIHNDGTWGVCESTQIVLYEDTAATQLGPVRYDKFVEAFGGTGLYIDSAEKFRKLLNVYYFQDGIICFNLMMDKYEYSPGTVIFNKILEQQK